MTKVVGDLTKVVGDGRHKEGHLSNACLGEMGVGVMPDWERLGAFLGEVHFFAGDLSLHIGHR